MIHGILKLLQLHFCFSLVFTHQCKLINWIPFVCSFSHTWTLRSELSWHNICHWTIKERFQIIHTKKIVHKKVCFTCTHCCLVGPYDQIDSKVEMWCLSSDNVHKLIMQVIMVWLGANVDLICLLIYWEQLHLVCHCKLHLCVYICRFLLCSSVFIDF